MAIKSTQDFLEVDQIRNGVLILKNKGIRGILMVSSINLALKSEEEQRSVIYGFQEFLNSLDFACQIIVQSRKTNITGYIDKIKELEKNQENEMLKHQTAGYREFLEQFIKRESILTKKFFVVVPYSIGEAKKGQGGESKKPATNLTEERFERAKVQLTQRMEFVALGLRRCGLQSSPLTTSEIMELFWGLHHPREAERGYYPEFPEEFIN